MEIRVQFRSVLGALVMLCSPALAGTWYVNGGSGDNGNNCKTKTTACPTIGRAISLAASGDTIQIAAATYQENLSIPFDLTLNGAKASTTIIDGTNTFNVLTVGAGISLTLSNLTIEKGVGYMGGGGGDNSGTLTVNDSLFYVNTALSGGAICNGGTLTITDSTFSNNSSSGNNGGYGGAIYTYAGALTVTNSTFSANSATTSGGAIYSEGGTVQISNSTFGNNPENIGGGGALSNAGSSFLIQNSIVANSANGGNCAGTITSNGYNLSSDSSCQFSSSGDLNNLNPMLAALQKYGGPTETMALQQGSPALDAGNPAGCRDFSGNLLKTDQRGLPRPGGKETTGCDIGAYESQAF